MSVKTCRYFFGCKMIIKNARIAMENDDSSSYLLIRLTLVEFIILFQQDFTVNLSLRL